MNIVLQKYISSAGLASRRKAEEMIREGRVEINDKKAELGSRVNDGDRVKVDGKVIDLPSEKIYIKLNKPRGYTCSNRKFKGENNVFELLDDKYSHLHIAGRLDKESRGLVILTNDGQYTEKITHPRYGHEKEYMVRVNALSKDQAELASRKLREGVDINEKRLAKAKDIEYLGEGLYRVILNEGRKRQIRRMFAALSLDVKDLLRTRVEDVKLGTLKEGEWCFISQQNICQKNKEK